MNDYGSLSVPLSMVGMYLNYAGNHILEFTHRVLKKKIFFPQHRVTSIQLLEGGEFLTTCQVRTVQVRLVNENKQLSYDFKVGEEEKTITFRSKVVIVANGGRSHIPRAFHTDWFPFMENDLTES
jgi:hypothetical protein